MQPIIGYHFYGHCEAFSSFQDTLVQKVLYRIIKPTFKAIISSACRHLSGPNEIKHITHEITERLTQQDDRFVIRTDIKSYYASIDHHRLKKMIGQHYDDPRVVKYLCDTIEAPIDRGGWYETPTHGIPRKSSLSGFFAALFLKPLDQCFDQRKDLFYCRYNDDILILCQTKRQYARAKRKLKNTIQQLKLQLAPTKTRMGHIESGFHFLGINFSVARTLESPQKNVSPKNQVEVSLHPRSIHRSIDKAKLMQEEVHALNNAPASGAGPPAEVQSYVYRWANWWANQHPQLKPARELVDDWRLSWIKGR